MSFPTVLIARKPPNKPTELEIVLRSQASKFRVVQRLSGGAHLLLPGSDTTIAVRTYYESDFKTPQFSDKSDGLEGFRDAFKYPIVFFVLPPRLMHEQLSQMDSFVNRAQQIMNERAKTFCVSDTKSVVDTILVLLDALHPKRRKLREKYYHHTQAMHYIGGHPTDLYHVSSHIKEEIRQLAQRSTLAPGEAEILMNKLGTLRAISTADEAILKDIPLETESKHKLLTFFGSYDDPICANAHPHVTNRETVGNELYLHDQGVIDDMFNYNQYQSSGEHDLLYTSQEPCRPQEMVNLPSFYGFHGCGQNPPSLGSHRDRKYQDPGFANCVRPPFGGQHQHQEQQYMIQSHNTLDSLQLQSPPPPLPQQQYFRPQSQWGQHPPMNHYHPEHHYISPSQQQQYFPLQPEYQPHGSMTKFPSGGVHRTPARAMGRFM